VTGTARVRSPFAMGRNCITAPAGQFIFA